MRKALIGVMIAATALTPLTAQAQDSGRWRRGGQEQGQAEAPSRDIQRAWQRYERRNEQRQQSQTQQVNIQQQSSQEVRGRQWSGNRGDGSRGYRGRDVQQQQQLQAQQQGQNDGRWQGRRGGDGDRNWSGNRRSDGRNWDGNRRYDGNRNWDGDRARNGDWQRNRGGSWSGNTYNWNRDGRNFSWSQNWRNNRRYDWQSYRRSNRHIFNVGRYYAPYRNYSYRRFSIGLFLEPLFFSQNYWLSDPYQYRLPYAPPGTRWIRYYDDVLLVDTYTGEVVDVIHNFFW